MAKCEGLQYMASMSSEQDAIAHFVRSKEIFGATNKDIVIRDVTPSWEFQQKYGIKSHYTVQWSTPLGWKVYMWLTGCLATWRGE